MYQKEFRKDSDNQKLINTDKIQKSTDLFKISKLLLKVYTELFMNSEIFYVINVKDWEITLRWETRKSIQYIKEKSQWNYTSYYILSDM